jgi:hypothetical protein
MARTEGLSPPRRVVSREGDFLIVECTPLSNPMMLILLPANPYHPRTPNIH